MTAYKPLVFFSNKLLLLIYALIIPKLNNANILMYGLTKFLIDRLKNVQNATTRVLTRTKKYERIKPVLKHMTGRKTRAL